MAKHGVFSWACETENQKCEGTSFATIKGIFCKKQSKVHLAINDPYHVPSIRLGNQHCTCGGHTFSTIWGGEKMVCRHCGKVYPKKEFQSLECKSLTPSEREDRRIFAILLSGGDLREHRERDVLVLKDHMGLPAGELPLEYARHFEETYRDATVITVRQKPKTEQSAVPAAMAVAN